MNHAFVQLYCASVAASLIALVYGLVRNTEPFWIIWTGLLYAASGSISYVWWAYSGTDGVQQVFATVMLVLSAMACCGVWEILDAPQPAWVRQEQTGDHDRI